MCFLSVQKKKKINWHSHTHTHSHTRFPPLTIFYLLVNVPNYSVKQCQRFAAWHAYWNGNATISEWKSFIRWLLSGFIHDNLLFTCRITLMRGLKGGVCVCVWLFSASMRGTPALEKKGHVSGCLQLSPLFRRRGLDLGLYRSRACRCALRCKQAYFSFLFFFFCLDCLNWVSGLRSHLDQALNVIRLVFRNRSWDISSQEVRSQWGGIVSTGLSMWVIVLWLQQYPGIACALLPLSTPCHTPPVSPCLSLISVIHPAFSVVCSFASYYHSHQEEFQFCLG